MKNSMKKWLSFVVCMVLIAAMALLTTGCNDGKNEHRVSDPVITGGETLGEGANEFTFVVVDGEGKEISAQIRTDKTIVGEALLDLGLIDGEPGPYGLYVMTVNGEYYTYEEHSKYWSFYENGNYAVTGVDMTEIVPGTTYMMKVEAG